MSRVLHHVEVLVLTAVLGSVAHAAAGDVRGDPAFADAVAAWQMGDAKDVAGRNPLTLVGRAELGRRLDGPDYQESLASGNDGRVAQFDGGYLDAGQGSEGCLNLSGSALTVSARLRSPSGGWGRPLFSKHGGHDRLVYNLYSQPGLVGFELGTEEGLTRTTAPLERIGAAEWHTIVACYDGTSLKMFVDGVLVDEQAARGPLREGNTLPCLIGAEDAGGIRSGWSGQIDHVAIWNRALTETEIVRLSGGADRAARLVKRYTERRLLPPRPDLYHEAYRPQFHFTARQWTVHRLNPEMREEGWLNDLNGLVYHAGEYHLFAQRWNKCWIHAVSTDLVHWTELPPAFWEDHRFGGGVQSGGAVVDHANSSGLSPDPRTPPMVAFWSGNDNFSTCIAYSLDRGRTWTKYAKNPVLRHPERDPKVFWHEPSKRWVLVLSGGGAYFLFTSTNLLDWTELREPIPRSYECPDMFPLPVAGDAHRQKWALVRGNGRYSLGEFDGQRFLEQAGQFPGDQGPNFYATMTWGEIAGQPGRRVQVAWMRCDGSRFYPEMPFNQQVSFPCDITLRDRNGGLRLFRKPVREIALLHRKKHTWNDIILGPDKPRPLDAQGELFHILADVEVPRGSEMQVRIRGTAAVVTDRSMSCDSRSARTSDPIRQLEFLVDRASIESFANEGEVSLSTCFKPTCPGLEVACTRGSAKIRSLEVFELDSIWDGAHGPARSHPGSP